MPINELKIRKKEIEKQFKSFLNDEIIDKKQTFPLIRHGAAGMKSRMFVEVVAENFQRFPTEIKMDFLKLFVFSLFKKAVRKVISGILKEGLNLENKNIMLSAIKILPLFFNHSNIKSNEENVKEAILSLLKTKIEPNKLSDYDYSYSPEYFKFKDANLEIKRKILDAVGKVIRDDEDIIRHILPLVEECELVDSVIEMLLNLNLVDIVLTLYKRNRCLCTRKAIITSLRDVKIPNNNVIDTLIQVLKNDKDNDIREAAIGSLRSLASRMSILIEPVFKAYIHVLEKDNYWPIRVLAVKALGELAEQGYDNNRIVKYISLALKDNNIWVRKTAVKTLEKFATLDNRIIDILIDFVRTRKRLLCELQKFVVKPLIEKFRTYSAYSAHRLSERLGEFLESRDDLVTLLQNVIKESLNLEISKEGIIDAIKKNNYDLKDAVEILAKLLVRNRSLNEQTIRKIINTLLDILKIEDEKIHETVLETISELEIPNGILDENNINILLNLLSRAKISDTRVAIIDLLRKTTIQLKTVDSRVIKSIIDALKDDCQEVRETAIRAISEMYESLEEFRTYESQFIHFLIDALKDNKRKHKEAILQIVNKQLVDTILDIAKYLSEESYDFRMEYIKLIGKLKITNKQIVNILVNFLEEGYDEVFIEATINILSQLNEALGKTKFPENYVIGALINALKDKDRKHRENVLMAIGKCNCTDNQVIDAILDAVEDESCSVRKTAIEIIPRFSASIKNCTDIVSKALEDDCPKVREAAIKALGELGNCSEQIINALIKILESDKSYMVRKTAVESLGKMGRDDKQVIKGLIYAFKNDEHFWVRKTAVKILEKLEAFNEKFIETIIYVLKNNQDREIRAVAIEALLKLIKLKKLDSKMFSEQLTSILIDILNRDSYSYIRECAAEALGELELENFSAQTITLVNVLRRREEEEKDVIEATAKVLGKIGIPTEEVIDVLIDILQDNRQPWYTREAAAEALGELKISDRRVIKALFCILEGKYYDIWTEEAVRKALDNISVSIDQTIEVLVEIASEEDNKKALKQLLQLGVIPKRKKAHPKIELHILITYISSKKLQNFYEQEKEHKQNEEEGKENFLSCISALLSESEKENKEYPYLQIYNFIIKQ